MLLRTCRQRHLPVEHGRRFRFRSIVASTTSGACVFFFRTRFINRDVHDEGHTRRRKGARAHRRTREKRPPRENERILRKSGWKAKHALENASSPVARRVCRRTTIFLDTLNIKKTSRRRTHFRVPTVRVVFNSCRSIVHENIACFRT